MIRLLLSLHDISVGLKKVDDLLNGRISKSNYNGQV